MHMPNDRSRPNPRHGDGLDNAPDQALFGRRQAAAQFRPAAVDLLLVAEAPPSSLDRYFYFTGVSAQDSLFRYVCRVLLGEEPSREKKEPLLRNLCERGV